MPFDLFLGLFTSQQWETINEELAIQTAKNDCAAIRKKIDEAILKEIDVFSEAFSMSETNQNNSEEKEGEVRKFNVEDETGIKQHCTERPAG